MGTTLAAGLLGPWLQSSREADAELQRWRRDHRLQAYGDGVEAMGRVSDRISDVLKAKPPDIPEAKSAFDAALSELNDAVTRIHLLARGTQADLAAQQVLLTARVELADAADACDAARGLLSDSASKKTFEATTRFNSQRRTFLTRAAQELGG